MHLRKITRGSSAEEMSAGRPPSTAVKATCRARGPCAKVQGSGSPITGSGWRPSVLAALSRAGPLLGSDAETGVAPGYASPSSCPLPRDQRRGRKEDLCQMSALCPPNQQAASSCRRRPAQSGARTPPQATASTSVQSAFAAEDSQPHPNVATGPGSGLLCPNCPPPQQPARPKSIRQDHRWHPSLRKREIKTMPYRCPGINVPAVKTNVASSRQHLFLINAVTLP